MLTSESLIPFVDNLLSSSVLQRNTCLLCMIRLANCHVLFALTEKLALRMGFDLPTLDSSMFFSKSSRLGQSGS